MVRELAASGAALDRKSEAQPYDVADQRNCRNVLRLIASQLVTGEGLFPFTSMLSGPILISSVSAGRVS